MARERYVLPSILKLTETHIPTKFGSFRLHLFRDESDCDHVAFVLGTVAGKDNILTRVHSECFTGEVLGSLRCDCASQLELALARISAAGCGVLIYLRQEGRGIGLLDKLRAYNLQDLGHDTVDANLLLGRAVDERKYHAAALILRELGVNSIELLTNNPSKIAALRDLGINIQARTPLFGTVHWESNHYIETKARRMGHDIDLTRMVTTDKTGLNGFAAMSQDPVTEIRRRAQGFLALRRRPFVTLSYAQSLDGCLSARPGEPLALSGSEALVLTHRLRAAHDVILIGIGTVLSDDPQLTVRKVDGPSPQPVVLDSRLRIPDDCRLVRAGAGRLRVASLEACDSRRKQKLEAAGISVLHAPSTPDGMVELSAVLRHLGELGVESVMVEGGVRVIRSFLDARLVDYLVVTVVPGFIGGEFAVRLQSQLLRGPRMEHFSQFKLGDDIGLCGAPDWAAAAQA
jgi:3,4-dihydroxy 2-butanone 4-phosphate synthase/GTP cyclohydrolase II